MAAHPVRTVQWVTALLFPTRCPVCGRAGSSPCAGCISTMTRATPLPSPPGLDRCAALLSYDGAARELVARLKYRNARTSLRWLALAMAGLVDGDAVDVVTFVPTTPTRRRARGFDQAELLARAVGRSLRVPMRPLLWRRHGAAQTGADAAARRAARIDVAARTPIEGAVLLVDDVVTTGTTISAAARALRAAGASRVIGLVAARTPPPGALH